MNLTTDSLLKSNLDQYTILIVDDNPTNLGVLSDYLNNYGFTTLVATDGELAIQRAKYIKPDIILLDVMMPGMDGFETCQHLKAHEKTNDIPIIFMTALAETESKIRGFEVGAVDYVTKPLNEQEVLARVTTHLSLRDLTQSLQKQNEALSKRAIQLEASSQVGQQATSILNLDNLLEKVVKLIQVKFGYYFVSICLLNEQQNAIILQTGAGRESQQLDAINFHIPLDTSVSIIIQVYQTGEHYLTNDVTTDNIYLPVSGLSETLSELALPLKVGKEVIGVLDIQSDKIDAFDDEDKTVLQTLANQIAIAIRNARLYELEQKFRYLEEARARDLAELNANKDRFFSIIAHDLKGPFQPLLSLSYVLSQVTETARPEKLAQMGESIHNAAQNVYSLLENLLQWSQIHRGQITYTPNKLNLYPIVEEIINLLTPNAQDKNIRLQNTVTIDTFVYADIHMLNTIIRNLISNALKFTPTNGQIAISATPRDASFMEVSIRDTGIGISPENMEKLFKIDVHHTTTGTAQEQGTGLGLIICREMVEQNGGRIWIESELEQGTIVKFTIPLNHLNS